MNRIFRNTIYYSIGEILPRAISFIMLPIYTKYLSPSDYGILAYAHSIALLLYVLGALALNSYVIRYYFIHTEERERSEVIGSIHLFIIIVNLLILFVGFLIFPSVIDRYGIQVPWNPYMRLALIINFFDCFTIIPLVVYRVRQEAAKFMALGASRTILLMLVTVYLVIYQQRGVLGALEAQLYVYFVYAIFYSALMRKHSTLCLKKTYLKEGLAFSLPLLPGSICFFLLTVSDRIILERNVAMSELGIYNVAASMSMALNIVVQSGYKALEPEIFKRYGKDDYFPFLNRAQKVYFAVIFICGLGLSLFSQEIFAIMTSEAFHRGYLLVPLLVLGVVFTGLNVIYGGVLQGEKRTKVQGLATVMSGLLCVSLNLILVPLWGVYAAAISSAISFMAMSLFFFWKMTYPYKRIDKELLLILFLIMISYSVFYFFDIISVQSVIIKLAIVLAYSYLVINIYNIKVKQILFLIPINNIR